MKRQILLLLLNLCLFYSCQETTRIKGESTNSTNFNDHSQAKGFIDNKSIKSTQVFRFKVNNTDVQQMGFLALQEDQSIGIRSVVINNDFVFLADPLHGNIKKINLKSGKIIAVSPKLDNENNLRTLAVFNNAIYVITDKENIKMMDFNFNKIDDLSVPNYKWVKDVFFQTENELVLFRPIEDVVQQADKSMKIKTLKIDVTKSIRIDSVILSYDEYTKSPYAKDNIRGKRYDYLNEDGRHYLLNEFGKFELKEELPTTYRYYDSKNLDFTSNKIVYYSVTPDEVILTVNNY
jgi:hypothetical protein